ncbi:MAG: hypothetical protein ACLP0J_22355 [Solirubrobacteraceae bacterium]|jgi:hypothetical protein
MTIHVAHHIAEVAAQRVIARFDRGPHPPALVAEIAQSAPCAYESFVATAVVRAGVDTAEPTACATGRA